MNLWWVSKCALNIAGKGLNVIVIRFEIEGNAHDFFFYRGTVENVNDKSAS